MSKIYRPYGVAAYWVNNTGNSNLYATNVFVSYDVSGISVSYPECVSSNNLNSLIIDEFASHSVTLSVTNMQSGAGCQRSTTSYMPSNEALWIATYMYGGSLTADVQFTIQTTELMIPSI